MMYTAHNKKNNISVNTTRDRMTIYAAFYTYTYRHEGICKAAKACNLQSYGL